MTRTKFALYMLLAATILLTLPALAQGRETKFDVPFAFNVGSRVLPAGTYGVERVFETWLMIRNLGTWDSVMASSSTISPPPRSPQWKLVFHCYGKKCFLYQTWVGAAASGRELIRSAEEIEVTRNVHRLTQEVIASKR